MEGRALKIFSIPASPGCIIFDIDSTLYTHPEYAHEQVDAQIRRFADLRGLSHDEGRETISDFRGNYERQHGRKISLGNAMTHFGVPIAESVRWRETLVDPARFLVPDPRLRETLLSLAARFALRTVTNNPVLTARKTLEALGVADIFPGIVGLDTTGFSKPHERPFLLAAESAGVEPAKCLSVGDRYDIDIALPLELGMGGILVDSVEDVYGLPALL